MPHAHREQLLHTLYEAAEVEHNLMCTYLYAAWSLKDAGDPGVTPEQAAMLGGWKRTILGVAIEEMSHLVSVWNITVALGGAPRIGRYNFPLAPGALPASLVVRLAPFSRQTLQHFIYLERAADSSEPDGAGFEPPAGSYARGNLVARHTPMPDDYATVGEFYASLKAQLDDFVAERGEALAFAGERSLQIAGSSYGLPRAQPVICAKTARQAFDAIVAEGEGATCDNQQSHFHRFVSVRDGLDALESRDPAFQAAFPAATNPVLRAPPTREGRVWIEDPDAIATVDLANAAYGLMLRAIAYAYAVPGMDPRKAAMLQLAIGLMQALSPLGEAAARMPAGPSNPGMNAGISFTALRDSAALPPGPAADLMMSERLREFAEGAQQIAGMSPRHAQAASRLAGLAAKYARPEPVVMVNGAATAAGSAAVASAAAPAAVSETTPGAGTPGAAATVAASPGTAPMEVVAGRDVEIHYHGSRCIHARFCVTGAPQVFLANVQGPWIHPDEMPAERLVEIAHACPSGAIAYRRLDGQPDEAAPPVNLAAIREAGPLAFRGALLINGEPAGFRATLCRCGASANKPFCDGSHKTVAFSASGEPPSGGTDALPVRDGPLQIDPQPDGPLRVNGNLEIVSGTGRIVARLTTTRLCRCGGSSSKPFCDGTHTRIGFRAPG